MIPRILLAALLVLVPSTASSQTWSVGEAVSRGPTNYDQSFTLAFTGSDAGVAPAQDMQKCSSPTVTLSGSDTEVMLSSCPTTTYSAVDCRALVTLPWDLGSKFVFKISLADRYLVPTIKDDGAAGGTLTAACSGVRDSTYDSGTWTPTYSDSSSVSYGGFNLDCTGGVCGTDSWDGVITRPTVQLTVDLDEPNRVGEPYNDGGVGFYKSFMDSGPPERCSLDSFGNATSSPPAGLSHNRADMACIHDGQCPGGTCVAAGTGMCAIADTTPCESDADCVGAGDGCDLTSGFQAVPWNLGPYLSAFQLAQTVDPIWSYGFNQPNFGPSPGFDEHPGVVVNHEMDYSPFGGAIVGGEIVFEDDPLLALGSGNRHFRAVIERYQQSMRSGCAGDSNADACNSWRSWTFNEGILGKGDWGADANAYATLSGRFPTLYDDATDMTTRLVDIYGGRWGTYSNVKPGVLISPSEQTGHEATVDIRTADWIHQSSMIGQMPEPLVNDMNRSPGQNGSLLQTAYVGSNVSGSFQSDTLNVNVSGPGYFGACADNEQPMCVGGGDAGEPCESDDHCAGGSCSPAGQVMADGMPCITNWQCRDDRDYAAGSAICVHGNDNHGTGTDDGLCIDDGTGLVEVAGETFCDDAPTAGVSGECDTGDTCVDIQSYYGQYSAALYGRKTNINFEDNSNSDDTIFYYGYCSAAGGQDEDEGEACIEDADCVGTCLRQDGSRYFATVLGNWINADISQTVPGIDSRQGTGSGNNSLDLSPASNADGRQVNQLRLLHLTSDLSGAQNQTINSGGYIKFVGPSGLQWMRTPVDDGGDGNDWKNMFYIEWADMWRTPEYTSGQCETSLGVLIEDPDPINCTTNANCTAVGDPSDVCDGQEDGFRPPLWHQAGLSAQGDGAAHAWELDSAGWDDGNWQWGNGKSVTWHTGTGTDAQETDQFRVKHNSNPTSSADGSAFMESDVGITAGIANSVFVQADTDGHRATQRTTMKVLSGVNSCIVFEDVEGDGKTACSVKEGVWGCETGETCDDTPTAAGDAITCGRATYSLDPLDDFIGQETTAMITAADDYTIVNTDDDCTGSTACWGEIANTDPLGEWGLCGADDTILAMGWTRSGATATFHLDCNLTWAPTVADGWIDIQLQSGSSTDIAAGSGEGDGAVFGFSRGYFLDAIYGKGTTTISVSGAVELDSGECVGVAIDDGPGGSDHTVTLSAGSCLITEVSECTETVP